MTYITRGQAVAFYAFDVGYEVALDQARQLLDLEPVPPLSRKKQSPIYQQYSTAPQVVQWGKLAPLRGVAGTVQVTLYDFGAVSVAYRWPLPKRLPLDDLAAVSAEIFQRNLDADARHRLETFLGTIAPAITRPEFSSLVEDYYVFVAERFDEALSGSNLIERHGDALAQAVRLDTQPLSDEQRGEALARAISYYRNDLVVIDWNAALIADPDYEDALNIFELLNVELLEARYIDAQLDRRINNYERLRERRFHLPLPFRTPYKREIEELSDLRIDSSLLTERVDNALKLIGDDYLARVYAVASQRLYLHEWNASIAGKLSIIEDLYQVLTDRVSTAQNHTLELIVIVLIIIEILLALPHLH